MWVYDDQGVHPTKSEPSPLGCCFVDDCNVHVAGFQPNPRPLSRSTQIRGDHRSRYCICCGDRLANKMSAMRNPLPSRDLVCSEVEILANNV
jgi:hypothetical protein